VRRRGHGARRARRARAHARGPRGAYVADRNVDRYERTGKLDAAYLRSLSDDAAPALARLPRGMAGADRRCARLSGGGSLMAANVARARARELLCR